MCLGDNLSLTLGSLTKYRAERLIEALNAFLIILWAIGVNLLQVIYVHMKLYVPGCSGSGTVPWLEVARPDQVAGQVYFFPRAHKYISIC